MYIKYNNNNINNWVGGFERSTGTINIFFYVALDARRSEPHNHFKRKALFRLKEENNQSIFPNSDLILCHGFAVTVLYNLQKMNKPFYYTLGKLQWN